MNKFQRNLYVLGGIAGSFAIASLFLNSFVSVKAINTDLGEPFDFLTWFEFAPEHTKAFDELLVRMRASIEWEYVEREVEVRLIRDDIS